MGSNKPHPGERPLGVGSELQASGETALQKYRHAGTLKQAGLGVWGMRQHGESTRSCERPPPDRGTKKKNSGQRPQRATRGVVLPLSC